MISNMLVQRAHKCNSFSFQNVFMIHYNIPSEHHYRVCALEDRLPVYCVQFRDPDYELNLEMLRDANTHTHTHKVYRS